MPSVNFRPIGVGGGGWGVGPSLPRPQQDDHEFTAYLGNIVSEDKQEDVASSGI